MKVMTKIIAAAAISLLAAACAQTSGTTEYNVHSKEFAAETANNPAILESLGQAITPTISQFGEYIPVSEGGDKPNEPVSENSSTEKSE